MYTPGIQDEILKKMLPTQSQPERHAVKVNGRAGAEAYTLPPNSDELLLDLNNPIVWFVQTDGAGYKTVTGYDISLHKEVTQQDILKSLDERISRMEEVLLNGKSNNPTAKPNKFDRNNETGARSNAQG